MSNASDQVLRIGHLEKTHVCITEKFISVDNTILYLAKTNM